MLRPILKSGGILLLLCLFLASAAAAQGTALIRGRVLEAGSMAPISAVFVFQEGAKSASLSDSLGYFSLAVEPKAQITLRASQLGYDELAIKLAREAFDIPQILVLTPNPIELEGLTVLVDRLAARRSGAYGVAEVLGRAELLRAPGGTGYDLVLRTLPFAAPCSIEDETLCLGGATNMGEPRQVKICVDDREVPVFATQSALTGIDPRGLFMVEVFSRAGEVRMYTPGYMKRLAENGQTLPPLSFGCTGSGGGG